MTDSSPPAFFSSSFSSFTQIDKRGDKLGNLCTMHAVAFMTIQPSMNT